MTPPIVIVASAWSVHARAGKEGTEKTPPGPLSTTVVSARSALETVTVTPVSPWPSVPRTLPMTVVGDGAGAGMSVRLPRDSFWPGGGGGTSVPAPAGQPPTVPVTVTAKSPLLVGRPATVKEPSAPEVLVDAAPPATTVTVAPATLAPAGSTTNPLTAVPGSATLVIVTGADCAARPTLSLAMAVSTAVWPAGGAVIWAMKGAVAVPWNSMPNRSNSTLAMPVRSLAPATIGTTLPSVTCVPSSGEKIATVGGASGWTVTVTGADMAPAWTAS